FYKYALDTGMNEFTAPVILPLVLIAMILYDKMVMPKEAPALNIHEAIVREHEKKSPFLQSHDPHSSQFRLGFGGALRFATSETVGHIGALIILMALSASVGGLIERTEIVEMLP
ncbi:hypothetical protein WAJ08_20370, partial [Acinetobacter baumannii]